MGMRVLPSIASLFATCVVLGGASLRPGASPLAPSPAEVKPAPPRLGAWVSGGKARALVRPWQTCPKLAALLTADVAEPLVAQRRQRAPQRQVPFRSRRSSRRSPRRAARTPRRRAPRLRPRPRRRPGARAA
jgi:hypothetical protein